MIYLELFLTFFKIGLFTFGGGYAMLPLIQEEVLNQGWMELSELINFVAIAESTPGPFAINVATFVGAHTAEISILGSICATLGVVMPSFIIILIVARCFEKFKSNKIVKWCMFGLKAAVVGLIGSAVVSIGQTVLFPSGIEASVFQSATLYISVDLFAVCVALSFKKVHPIVIVLISASVGIACGYIFAIPV